MTRRIAGAMMLALAGVPTGMAHDLYLRPLSFRPNAGSIMRVEFHNGETFPKSQVPVVLTRLRMPQLVSPGGAPVPIGKIHNEGRTTVGEVPAPQKAGVFFLTAETAPNFIQLEPGKFEDYLRHESLKAVLAERARSGEARKPGREIYAKFVKAIGFVGEPGPGFDQPLGQTIEFVPLSDPNQLKAGETLTVRVLFRGQAAAGLPVESSRFAGGRTVTRQAGVTDSNGEVRILIDRLGLWKFHAILMQRHSDPKTADWESFWASLTFENGPSAK